VGVTPRIARFFAWCSSLQPIERDQKMVKAIFDEIDRLGCPDFLPEGRPEQPPMPPGRVLDECLP
jgi:hypothetical protein